MNYKLVLATDLDGTFLEGNDRLKYIFYQELNRLRDHIMLVYTTGRPVEIVKQLCLQGYLPYCDYVIGDHGTHVVDGSKFSPINELQNVIIEKWANATNTLKELLRNDNGIELQPLNPPYRVAYYYDPELLQASTVQKIIDSGYDAILSCDMYLDIVPRGVNKGTTLLNLLNHLNVSSEHVITCGDSLNDLSLFQTKLNGIAVGNAEPKLLLEIENQKLNNVYISIWPGVSGIIDGLHFYNKLNLFNFNLDLLNAV